MNLSENDFWTSYWTSNPIIENDDLHCQVGRTVHKIPIDQKKWQITLSEIEKILDLNSGDILLDLCAGNGLITIPLSQKCRSATAVDISNTLLDRIDTRLYPNIIVIAADVRNVDLPAGVFSRGLMYGALQYFSEREAIGILDIIYNSLTLDGVFLVGDIPDIDRIFTFYKKPEWVISYFDSLKNNTPSVGNWFKKDLLVKMAEYVGFRKAEVRDQHPDLINSHYRFDLLLTK